MDLGKLIAQRRSLRKRKKGDTARLAAQLAPLEEQTRQTTRSTVSGSTPVAGQPSTEFGGFVIDSTDLPVPKEILEGGGEKTFMGMEPVVLVILGLMLLFIAFVAWQISLMPE